MSVTITTVKNLSKRDLIGHKSGEGSVPLYSALRDVLGADSGVRIA
jgi:hypothetical protein